MKKNYKTITNVSHLRQIVTEIINQLRNDEIDNQTAQAIASLCSLQLKILKAVDLDKRIKRLEQGDFNENKTYSPVISDIQSHLQELKN